jgi:hypothetical protein
MVDIAQDWSEWQEPMGRGKKRKAATDEESELAITGLEGRTDPWPINPEWLN